MAWQLIYTSAPRGLVPGRSGFCTVARHREIRAGLVTEIERFSQYDRSGRATGAPSPVVHAHRIVRLSGATFHVLSCTRDAGADYTGRTNHLAHHLICEPHELTHAPSPAEVLRQMAWRQTWSDAPRHLGAEEAIDLRAFQRTAELPAHKWQALTGDAGCAALPLESGALAGCHWLYPPGADGPDLLAFFAESLLLLDPAGRSAEKLWQVPFTTYLQSTDHAADFFWRGCWPGTPVGLAAQGARQTLDFSAPHSLRAPSSEAAELARRGRRATPEAATAAAPTIAPTPAWKPEPRTDSTNDELDLDELLASAYDGTPAKSKREREERDGTRRTPLRLLLAASMALLLCGAVALGVRSWRSSHAERQRNQLLARMTAELDAASGQSPDDVRRYLLANREHLDAPELRDDTGILARRERLERWLRADETLNAITRRIEAAPLREPAADASIEQDLAAAERLIATLDADHRAPIAKQLEAIRLLQEHRRPAPEPPPPAPLPGTPTPPVAPAPVVAKPEAPAKPSGLPTMKTYLAIAAGKNFDVSGVEEMRRWTALPSGETTRLFLAPEPPLAHPPEFGQDTAVSNGKLYDGGTPLLSFQPQPAALVVFDDKARARLGNRFALLFGGASGDFYVHCGEAGERTAALVTLPERGWLVWDQKAGAVTLREDLVAALTRMKFAGTGAARLVLRARGWGDRELPIALPGSGGGPLRLELAPLVQAIEREMEGAKKANAAPKALTWEDHVRAAMAARELLMGKEDSLGFSRLGAVLFGLKEGDHLATTREYLRLDGAAPEPFRNGRGYLEYTQALFYRLAQEIQQKIGTVAAEREKETNPRKRKELNERRQDMEAQHAVIGTLLASFKAELEPLNLTKRRCDNVVAIWTSLKERAEFNFGPGKRFRDEWLTIFTGPNIETIRPFLEWNISGNDGELGYSFARLPPKSATSPEAITETLAALRHRIEAELPALAPFSLDFKLADGTVLRLVNILEAAEEATASR